MCQFDLYLYRIISNNYFYPSLIIYFWTSDSPLQIRLRKCKIWILFRLHINDSTSWTHTIHMEISHRRKSVTTECHGRKFIKFRCTVERRSIFRERFANNEINSDPSKRNYRIVEMKLSNWQLPGNEKPVTLTKIHPAYYRMNENYFPPRFIILAPCHEGTGFEDKIFVF